MFEIMIPAFELKVFSSNYFEVPIQEGLDGGGLVFTIH